MTEIEIEWYSDDERTEAWNVSWMYDSPELNRPGVEIYEERVLTTSCKLKIELNRWVFVNVFSLRGQHVTLQSESLSLYATRW